MSNAFAPIVRARPDPIFGRPVHPGSPPIDYSPILLRIPFGFHLAADTLSSEARRSVAPGPSCLFPAFAFVPHKTSHIPSSRFGQRGITPAFGYGAPHPSAGGT